MGKHLLLIALFIFCSPILLAQLAKSWDQRFGGNSSDYLQKILQLNDGSFLLGGMTYSYVSGNKTSPQYGEDDFWVVKTDSNGNKLWEAEFGGNEDDEMYNAIETPDTGFLLGGYAESGASGNKTQASWGIEDFYAVKIDSLGNHQWDHCYGGGNEEYMQSLCNTHDGGYLLGGYSNSGSSGDKTQASY